MANVGEVLTQLCKDFLAAEGDMPKQARVAAIIHTVLKRTEDRVRAWKQTATKQ